MRLSLKSVSIAKWAITGLFTIFLGMVIQTFPAMAVQSNSADKVQRIRVVMDNNYPPYVFKDDHGQLKGIVVDQWRLWEKKTGIRAELTGMDWKDAEQRMEEGEFDVIDTIFRNEQREKLYDFSKPYARLDVPLFFHVDISGIRGAADLKGFLVAVKAGDNVIDELKRQGVTNITVYPSYGKLIEAARDGKVKIFSVDRPSALYYLNKMGIQDQFRETEPLYSGELHRAVAKGNVALLRTVEHGFAAISKTEYQAIDKLWMGTPLSGLLHFKYAGYVVGAIAATISGLLIWLWTLKRAVARKTRELAASEGFLTSIIENIPNMIFVKDAKALRFVKFNKAGEQLLGIPHAELIGKNDYDFFPKDEADHFTLQDREVLSTGQGLDIAEEPIQTRTGQRILHTRKIAILEPDGSPKYLVGISEDITDRKRAEQERLQIEQQLLHAQKLESLGVLAGGIAHDFNNILTAIIGNAELVRMRLNPESPVLDNLERIEKAAARAADLARQMLAYSGKGKFVIEPIDLNRLVEDMGHMLEVSISKKVILRYNLTRPLPAIHGDATQIRQIVMNLVINASEAIEDRSGAIAITTGYLECDESYLKDVWLIDPVPEGLYVFLKIADTGCGMDKETMGKLFDPFFSTKFTGRGLGMAAVLGIIRGHKGAVKVYSEPGKGSTFKVLFPAGERPAELFNGDVKVDSWRGSGVVLLVDDEETIRAIGSEMLKELGFTPITANDGRNAVEIFKSTPDIRFVIMDLTMPHMDGEQCLRELRILDPNVRVIMTSGFSEHEITRKFAGKGLAGFVQKPYKLSALKEAIRRI